MKKRILTVACAALLAGGFSVQAEEAKTAEAAAPAADKAENTFMKKPCGMKKMRGPDHAFREKMRAEMQSIVNTEDHEKRREMFEAHMNKVQEHMEARMAQRGPKPRMAPGQLKREMQRGERRQDMETMMREMDPAKREEMMAAYQKKMQQQMMNRRMMRGGPAERMAPPAAGAMGNAPKFGNMPPPPPGMMAPMRGPQGGAQGMPSMPSQKEMMERQIKHMEQRLEEMKKRMAEMK